MEIGTFLLTSVILNQKLLENCMDNLKKKKISFIILHL